MKEQENRNSNQIQVSHIKYENKNIGEVQIADEVVATIAALAAKEVKGVAGTTTNLSKELVNKLGMKSQSKGVKITVNEANVAVDVSLVLEYGYSIPATSKKVQEKIKSAIENMTGLTVTEVNIRISGVAMEYNK